MSGEPVMATKREQIGKDRRFVNMDGKAIKKETSRARRREEKKDPENAPKQERYKGWVG